MKSSKPQHRLLNQSLRRLSRSHNGLSAEGAEVPVYEAICRDCEVAAEYIRTVDQCMDTPVCVSCGEKMHKVILSAPKGFVKGKFEPFISTVDGTLISSQKDMDEHNRRNNVVNLADGYDNDTVIRGDYIKQEEKDINDLKADIAEATAMVKQGYKPHTEVYTDD